jgi:hypothetical protein
MSFHIFDTRGAKRRAATLFVLFTALLSTTAPAADPPVAKKPVVVGYGAVRSFDALQELADQIGLPLPPPLTLAGAEQLPFLGPGSVAGDQPLGILMFGGPGVAVQNAAAVVLPVNAGKATVQSLTRLGARPVAGKPNAVMMGNGVFRRTDKHLVFGAQPDGILAADAGTIAAALKGPDELARVVLDLRAMKAAMPEQFDAFFEQSAMRNIGPSPGEQAGARLVVGFMKGLDRVTLGVDRGADALRVLATIQPLKMPPPTPGIVRPGMPEGLVARLDLACPPTKALPLLERNAFRKLMDQSAPPRMRLKPAQRERVLDLLADASQLFLGADATSVGVQVGSGGGNGAAGSADLVVYIVNQYTRPVDVIKDVRALAQKFEAMKEETGDAESPVELGTYKSLGATVTRAKLLERGRRIAFVDFVQRDRSVLITFSQKENAFIDGLLKAKAPDGAPEPAAMSGLATGTIDVGAMTDLLAAAPDGPLAKMPPEQSKPLRERMRGQRLALSAVGEGDGVTLDMTIPTRLLKDAVESAGAR